MSHDSTGKNNGPLTPSPVPSPGRSGGAPQQNGPLTKNPDGKSGSQGSPQQNGPLTKKP